MITETWRVVLTRADLPTTTSPPPFALEQCEQRVDWMRRERLVDGLPYSLSPAFQWNCFSAGRRSSCPPRQTRMCFSQRVAWLVDLVRDGDSPGRRERAPG
jgi:hypothetical protein